MRECPFTSNARSWYSNLLLSKGFIMCTMTTPELRGPSTWKSRLVHSSEIDRKGYHTWKCMRRCSRPNRSFSADDLVNCQHLGSLALCTNPRTYARGLFRAHRLVVSSPYALISLRSPSNFIHSGSSLMRATAVSNCAVLLFGDKTSR